MVKLKPIYNCILIVGTFLLFTFSLRAQLPPQIPGLPPFPENALYNIELANIYANLLPDKNEMQVTMTLWLLSGGNPVVVKLGGNLMSLGIEGDQKDLEFIRVPPYYHFNNLKAGSNRITFTYSVRYDGVSTDGVISSSSLNLGAASFWYPKNIASDPHQVLLTIETPPDYHVTSNAKMEKETPNNLKTMREFILSVASDDGLTLSSE